jgi:hypothetical protein
MNISYFNANILTDTAITALKNAYDECSDNTVKESIFTASKAIIQLHHDLVKYGNNDKTTTSDGDFDPSEYCAAV